jgi:ATP-dependent Clp protease adapter protein ClpS
MLPPWKVLLHNDDKNDIGFVVITIVELTPLNEQDAVRCTLEAHENKLALLLTTHKERAELYKEQFESKGLTVTIEPAEGGGGGGD